MSKTDATQTEPKLKRTQETNPLKVSEVDGTWSAEDDSQLLSLVDVMKDEISWPKVAKLISGRTSAACQARWEELIKRDGKKGNWTTLEDEQLRQWVDCAFIIGQSTWTSRMDQLCSTHSRSKR